MRRKESTRARTRLGALVLATAAGWTSGAVAQDITVTSYGGIWEKAINECYASEFNKRTGYKANVLIGSPAQWMSQVEANPDNPPIHVIVSTEPGVITAGEKGLYAKMTDNMELKNVFYACVVPFLVFFAAFAGIIYPNR